MTAVSDHDFALPQGRLHGRITGSEHGPLALLVPGLTANLISMERIARALADAGWRALAVDLRGRGHSETTPPGTYGWERHARDLLDLADRMRVARFAVVGWSMGAFVAQQVAVLAPERVSHLALIDAAGPPAPEAMAPVMAAVERLRDVYPSADAYVERVRSIGTLTPWEEIWERYLRYELVEVQGGVRSLTSHDAVLEDVGWGSDHDPAAFWPQLRGPVLLVRATLPFLPSLPRAFVVPAEAVPGFLAQVEGASLVEVEANHYGVGVSPPTAAAVVESFKGGSGLP
jgi:pimeloyl-ACP methyl ester carboxylesterase